MKRLIGYVHIVIKPIIPLIETMVWSMRSSFQPFLLMSYTSEKLRSRNFTLRFPVYLTSKQNEFTPILYLA